MLPDHFYSFSENSFEITFPAVTGIETSFDVDVNQWACHLQWDLTACKRKNKTSLNVKNYKLQDLK